MMTDSKMGTIKKLRLIDYCNGVALYKPMTDVQYEIEQIFVNARSKLLKRIYEATISSQSISVDYSQQSDCKSPDD